MIGLLIVTTIGAVFISCYLWVKQRYRYWEDRKIPYLKPDSLFYGNDYELVSGRLSMSESTAKHYNDLAPHKFGGIFHYYKPVLYIRDPELIKHILIRDFNHFRDHLLDLANKEDPMTLLLFNLTGDEWKVLRQKWSSTFTSGKLKMLFELMKGNTEEMNRIIDRCATDHKTVNVQDMMTRYAVDVVSSCAFGIAADSLNDPESEFRAKIKDIFDQLHTSRRKIREMLFSLSPALVRFLRFTLFPQRVTNFLVDLVKDTMSIREKSGIVRNDFLNTLINLKNEDIDEMKNAGLTFNAELLAAQCFTFFNAGTRPTATSLSFILYELAENPDVQKKLQEEVDTVLQKYNGQITYESLKEMHYMDKVFNETSRLFPVSRVIRICNEDYQIPGSNSVIKKGESLFISPYGLHRDPKYYPNPDVFNPENFSEEAIASRPDCTFLPFGVGPRNCIAKRFAVMQVMLALITIMRQYTVSISPKMKLPIQYTRHVLLTDPKDEILLDFKHRDLIPRC